MKRTVKLSLAFSGIMGLLVLLLPYFASPKLVLRFLPKDIYEAGKDHPAPSPKRQLVGHLLTAAAGCTIVLIMKDIINRIKREKVGFNEAFKRLLAFLYIEKAFDIIVLDQFLCMTSGYYKKFYPETKNCEGWKNRDWNNKQQLVRLLFFPILCAVEAYYLTRSKNSAK